MIIGLFHVHDVSCPVVAWQDGKCIVHDMFGHEVVRALRQHYSDAFLTAHFEVPSEMFALAMAARARGRGVVGSTQNLLDFILARTKEALRRGAADHLQFVLGTESGMVTSIVQAVQALLREEQQHWEQQQGEPQQQLQAGSGSQQPTGHSDGAPVRPQVAVEIVFPVDSGAVAAQDEASAAAPLSPSAAPLLPVVPGVKAGEGCSAAGGCASCPYMKVGRDCTRTRTCCS